MSQFAQSHIIYAYNPNSIRLNKKVSQKSNTSTRSGLSLVSSSKSCTSQPISSESSLITSIHKPGQAICSITNCQLSKISQSQKIILQSQKKIVQKSQKKTHPRQNKFNVIQKLSLNTSIYENKNTLWNVKSPINKIN